jgi:hypothetical protein
VARGAARRHVVSRHPRRGAAAEARCILLVVPTPSKRGCAIVSKVTERCSASLLLSRIPRLAAAHTRSEIAASILSSLLRVAARQADARVRMHSRRRRLGGPWLCGSGLSTAQLGLAPCAPGLAGVHVVLAAHSSACDAPAASETYSSPRTCPMALSAPCSTSTSACSTHAFSSKGICTARAPRVRSGRAQTTAALTPGGGHALRQRLVCACVRRIVQHHDERELLGRCAARCCGLCAEGQRRKHRLDPHKDGTVCDG